MAAQPVFQDGQSLAAILANMVRSALVWEENHGKPQEVSQSGGLDALTGVPLGVCCQSNGTGGKGNGHGDHEQERPQPDHL